jgi:hypothetical protein
LVDAKGLTADQLRELARIIETAVPIIDSGLEAEYRELQDQLEGVQTPRSHRPLIAGLAVASVLGGVGLGAFWNPWIGAALVLLGFAAFVWLVFRSGEAGRSRVAEALREVEARVLSQRNAAKDAQEKLNTTRAQIIELALPADGKTLREFADGLVLAERHRQMEADWLNSREELGSEVAQAGNAVAAALRDAGIVGTTDLTAAFQEYERACRSRAEQWVRTGTRQSLAQQLLDRQSAEQAVCDAQARRSSAEQRILAVLAPCGSEAPDPDTASELLGRWQTERKATLIKFDEATREYAELNALLDGGTLEDLEAQTYNHERQAAELAAEFAVSLR